MFSRRTFTIVGFCLGNINIKFIIHVQSFQSYYIETSTRSGILWCSCILKQEEFGIKSKFNSCPLRWTTGSRFQGRGSEWVRERRWWSSSIRMKVAAAYLEMLDHSNPTCTLSTKHYKTSNMKSQRCGVFSRWMFQFSSSLNYV